MLYVLESSPVRILLFIFRCMGKPVLVALLAGKAAYNAETLEESIVVDRVLSTLKKVFFFFILF